MEEADQVALAGGCVCGSWDWFDWRRSAGASDHSVFTVGFFLFCKRVRPVSQVVYGNEDISESSGELCEEQSHDFEDEALYSVPGFFYADHSIFDDESSFGKDFYRVSDDFQICVFFYADQDDSGRDSQIDWKKKEMSSRGQMWFRFRGAATQTKVQICQISGR